MADRQEILRLEELAHRLRVDLCRLCGSYQGNIHMGGDMSMSDVLTCLFHHTMKPEGHQDAGERPFYSE